MYYAGYHALDLLDASVAGDEAATEEVKDLLRRTPSHLQQAPKPRLSKEEAKRALQQEQGHDPKSLECLPPGRKMLDVRPRPEVVGKRHVPVFAIGQRLPFLRFSKPQPANLSRVLRQKTEQRISRLVHMQNLQGFHIPLAQMEDDWDELIREAGGRPADDESEPYWADAAHELSQSIAKDSLGAIEKAKVLAKRMLDIVEQEKKLAEEENSKATMPSSDGCS